MSSLPLFASCALLCLLASACNTEKCEMNGEVGPWGYHLMEDLPQGACEARDPTCSVQTKDSCGEGEPGPRIDWKCTCTGQLWSCQEFARSKAACLPGAPTADADAAVGADANAE